MFYFHQTSAVKENIENTMKWSQKGPRSVPGCRATGAPPLPAGPSSASVRGLCWSSVIVSRWLCFQVLWSAASGSTSADTQQPCVQTWTRAGLHVGFSSHSWHQRSLQIRHNWTCGCNELSARYRIHSWRRVVMKTNCKTRAGAVK